MKTVHYNSIHHCFRHYNSTLPYDIDFWLSLENDVGLKVSISDDGRRKALSATFTIVDEEKYTMFLLKYSK